MLGPKEPNLYKDLSQGTVTKGIQIKIFSPPNFFFFLKIWIWIQIFRKKNFKKFFFLIFTFPHVTIMKI